MLKRFHLPLAALVAALTLMAVAAAAETEGKLLCWKLKPGQTLHYQMVVDMNQKIHPGEGAAPMNITHNQTFDMTWKVEAVQDDGTIKLAQQFDRIRMKLQTPQGVMLEYDSGSGKEPEGMAKMVATLFEAMLKKPILVTFTARGEMKETKLPQGLMETINKAVGGGQGGNILSDDWIKQMGSISVFPEGPVTPGQTWSRKGEMKIPVLGSRMVETTFRYDGTEVRDGRTVEKIGQGMQLQSQGKGQEDKKPAMFDIQQQEYKGTMYFDNQAGYPVGSDAKMTMKMAVNVMGKKMDMDMDMTMTMKLVPPEKGKTEAKE